MPRQLPWKSSGGGGRRTQTPKPTTAASTPRTRPWRNTAPYERAPSSSPPPLADCLPPHDEPMRNGVSEFDLRDDEWMMVEDEFLDTATLFTRHLRIAEYERLKARIEAKKNEAHVLRPVVTGAQRSVDGALKERARCQESRQKRAIRHVFASQADSSEDDRAPYRTRPGTVLAPAARPAPRTDPSQQTDSDDLDAPRPPKPKAACPATAPVAETWPTTRVRPACLPSSRPAARSFVKPALPAMTAAPMPRSRSPRLTPFEMLDEYAPPTLDRGAAPAAASPDRRPCSARKPRSRPTPSMHSSPPTSQTTAAPSVRPRRSVHLLDDWGPSGVSGGISPEVRERMAKRRAGRAREGSGKEERSVTNLDDIPTFLF